jgi:hypothetical protein
VTYNLASSGDGLKTLRLWAMDASGVISATPGSTTFYLDTAPFPQLASPPVLPAKQPRLRRVLFLPQTTVVV